MAELSVVIDDLAAVPEWLLLCRAVGHQWAPSEVEESVTEGQPLRGWIWQCRSCRSRKREIPPYDNRPLARGYQYRPGYIISNIKELGGRYAFALRAKEELFRRLGEQQRAPRRRKGASAGGR